MATNLYINPDNTIGGLESGKVMVAPTQEEFEECCCVVPCVDCGGVTVQPSLVGSVVDDACDALCLNAAGTIPFDEFVSDGPEDPGNSDCTWYWFLIDGDGGAGTKFYAHAIRRDTIDGKFWAYARFFGDDYVIDWGDAGTDGAKDVTALVTCDPVTGFLAGAYSLDGLDTGSKDCTGCTLEVTLGG